jgi:RNA polymerase sigma-70 factor (ECF subfamily)
MAISGRNPRKLITASLVQPGIFGEIVRRHFTPVHRYLHRRAGRDIADDVSAEVFAIAFERRGNCTGQTALPWLYGIATNRLRRYRRTEERRLRAYARSGRDEFVELGEDAINERLDASAEGRRLSAALASLRPRHRDVLTLFALADLSYEEIALALNVPIGTVRTWLHRAREGMRTQLAQYPSSCPPSTQGVMTDG